MHCCTHLHFKTRTPAPPHPHTRRCWPTPAAAWWSCTCAAPRCCATSRCARGCAGGSLRRARRWCTTASRSGEPGAHADQKQSAAPQVPHLWAAVRLHTAPPATPRPWPCHPADTHRLGLAACAGRGSTSASCAPTSTRRPASGTPSRCPAPLVGGLSGRVGGGGAAAGASVLCWPGPSAAAADWPQQRPLRVSNHLPLLRPPLDQTTSC